MSRSFGAPSPAPLQTPFDRLRRALLRRRSFLRSGNRIAQAFARGECRHASRRYHEFGTRLRIAALALLPFFDDEASEGNELNFFAINERIANGVEREVDDLAELPFREIDFTGKGVDEFRFCQRELSKRMKRSLVPAF